MRRGRFLTSFSGSGLFWFRLGSVGPGLVMKDLRRYPLSFTEREGGCRMLRLGSWMIRYLADGR